MAIETLSIGLTGSNVKGTDYITGDKNDNQIVTLTDDGDITGTVQLAKFGKDGIGTETGDPDGGDDTFIIDLSTFDDDFDITVKSMDSGDSFQVSGWDTHTVSGTLHTFTYTGTDGETHTVTINTFSAITTGGGVDPNVTIVCFVKGTLIETETGKLQVELLSKDMQIVCGDGQLRPIRWIGSTKVGKHALNAKEQLLPIRIRKNAFAQNSPSRDLYVSPQHRIVIRGLDVDLLFGSYEVLVAAKHLVDGVNITIHKPADSVEYFHILFDDHQTIYSEDLETESFFPGNVGLGALDQEVQGELLELFPDIAENIEKFGPTCKPALKAFEMNALSKYRVISSSLV